MHGGHLLGFHELTDTLGVSKQNARKHVAKPGFPRPPARLACGPIWDAGEVEAYLERRRR